MRAVADTSVIVAAILEGSAAHSACVEALAVSDAAAAGHAWFESMSVLTRLPPDIRLSAPDAHRAMTTAVAGVRLLSTDEQLAFQAWLPTSGIAGDALYDALVGWAARAAGLPLITRDVRAIPTYRSIEIELLVIEPTFA